MKNYKTYKKLDKNNKYKLLKGKSKQKGGRPEPDEVLFCYEKSPFFNCINKSECKNNNFELKYIKTNMPENNILLSYIYYYGRIFPIGKNEDENKLLKEFIKQIFMVQIEKPVISLSQSSENSLFKFISIEFIIKLINFLISEKNSKSIKKPVAEPVAETDAETPKGKKPKYVKKPKIDETPEKIKKLSSILLGISSDEKFENFNKTIEFIENNKKSLQEIEQIIKKKIANSVNGKSANGANGANGNTKTKKKETKEEKLLKLPLENLQKEKEIYEDNIKKSQKIINDIYEMLKDNDIITIIYVSLLKLVEDNEIPNNEKKIYYKNCIDNIKLYEDFFNEDKKDKEPKDKLKISQIVASANVKSTITSLINTDEILPELIILLGILILVKTKKNENVEKYYEEIKKHEVLGVSNNKNSKEYDILYGQLLIDIINMLRKISINKIDKYILNSDDVLVDFTFDSSNKKQIPIKTSYFHTCNETTVMFLASLTNLQTKLYDFRREVDFTNNLLYELIKKISNLEYVTYNRLVDKESGFQFISNNLPFIIIPNLSASIRDIETEIIIEDKKKKLKSFLKLKGVQKIYINEHQVYLVDHNRYFLYEINMNWDFFLILFNYYIIGNFDGNPFKPIEKPKNNNNKKEENIMYFRLNEDLLQRLFENFRSSLNISNISSSLETINNHEENEYNTTYSNFKRENDINENGKFIKIEENIFRIFISASKCGHSYFFLVPNILKIIETVEIFKTKHPTKQRDDELMALEKAIFLIRNNLGNTIHQNYNDKKT